ncbi:ABC transporter substrate-binding protein [Blautia sp. HCP3S3_G3]|uniref:ABC transporter substrate-binding protein n=1 Tax=Blautia sp. HCP3S3_G3 TaxID=3438913 RepID=UPI003F88A870
MKKSVLAAMLAAAMTVGTVPATVFAEEAAKPYEGVTLTMWIGNTEYNAGTQAVMAKATEELGMEFSIEINPGGTEGDNIIKTRCASGDLPDISNYNSGSLLTALNPKEHFLDITDEAMTQKFDETFLSCVSQEDRVYGAPFTTTQGGAVVYWKPDYEELGLEVPTTWEQFVSNCQALKDAGKTPIYLSCGDTWTTQLVFLGDNYNVLAKNPSFAEDFTAGTAKFASDEGGLASWNKYADLVDFYNADASAAKYDDGLEAMATGQATHWFMLTQVIPLMIAAHPEAEENIGVFAIPGDDPENCGLTVWEPNAWYISKDSANKEAALAFLDFYFQEENLDLYVETIGANGPSCIKGYTLPESVAPAIRVDMQAYFDAGKTAPALEFITPVKGSTCEQITTSAALGQIDGATAAQMYDDDCKKSAVQQGLGWE